MDRYFGIMFTAVTLAVLGGTASGAGDIADGSPLSKAFGRLAATEDALDRTRLKYLEVLDRNDLDAEEAEDFKGFILALDRQVHTVCEEVRRLGGDLSAHAAYCAQASDPGGASLHAKASTRAEIAAKIDSELDAAISEFDEMLLREQRSLEQHAQSNGQSNGQGNGQGNGSSGGGTDAGEGEADASGGGRQAQATDEWRDPDAEAAGGEGRSDPGAAGGKRQTVGGSVGRGSGGEVADVEFDIPDGRDDDVVARQLREAAMREQDPELRRRLWEEYKRYKQGGDSGQ